MNNAVNTRKAVSQWHIADRTPYCLLVG